MADINGFTGSSTSGGNAGGGSSSGWMTASQNAGVSALANITRRNSSSTSKKKEVEQHSYESLFSNQDAVDWISNKYMEDQVYGGDDADLWRKQSNAISATSYAKYNFDDYGDQQLYNAKLPSAKELTKYISDYNDYVDFNNKKVSFYSDVASSEVNLRLQGIKNDDKMYDWDTGETDSDGNPVKTKLSGKEIYAMNYTDVLKNKHSEVFPDYTTRKAPPSDDLSKYDDDYIRYYERDITDDVKQSKSKNADRVISYDDYALNFQEQYTQSILQSKAYGALTGYTGDGTIEDVVKQNEQSVMASGTADLIDAYIDAEFADKSAKRKNARNRAEQIEAQLIKEGKSDWVEYAKAERDRQIEEANKPLADISEQQHQGFYDTFVKYADELTTPQQTEDGLYTMPYTNVDALHVEAVRKTIEQYEASGATDEEIATYCDYFASKYKNLLSDSATAYLGQYKYSEIKNRREHEANEALNNIAKTKGDIAYKAMTDETGEIHTGITAAWEEPNARDFNAEVKITDDDAYGAFSNNVSTASTKVFAFGKEHNYITKDGIDNAIAKMTEQGATPQQIEDSLLKYLEENPDIDGGKVFNENSDSFEAKTLREYVQYHAQHSVEQYAQEEIDKAVSTAVRDSMTAEGYNGWEIDQAFRRIGGTSDYNLVMDKEDEIKNYIQYKVMMSDEQFSDQYKSLPDGAKQKFLDDAYNQYIDANGGIEAVTKDWDNRKVFNTDLHRSTKEQLALTAARVIPQAVAQLVGGISDFGELIRANVTGSTEYSDLGKKIDEIVADASSIGRTSGQSKGSDIINTAGDIAAEVIKMYAQNAIGGVMADDFTNMLASTGWGANALEAAGAVNTVREAAKDKGLGLFSRIRAVNQVEKAGLGRLITASQHIIQSSPFLAGAIGNYYAEAVDSGFNPSVGQATAYALVCGTLEGAIEAANVDGLWGKAIGTKRMAEGLKNSKQILNGKSVTNKLRLVNLALSFLGEGTEEGAGYLASLGMQRLTYNKDAQFEADEFWEQAIIGGITGVVGSIMSLKNVDIDSFIAEHSATHSNIDLLFARAFADDETFSKDELARYASSGKVMSRESVDATMANIYNMRKAKTDATNETAKAKTAYDKATEAVNAQQESVNKAQAQADKYAGRANSYQKSQYSKYQKQARLEIEKLTELKTAENRAKSVYETAQKNEASIHAECDQSIRKSSDAIKGHCAKLNMLFDEDFNLMVRTAQQKQKNDKAKAKSNKAKENISRNVDENGNVKNAKAYDEAVKNAGKAESEVDFVVDENGNVIKAEDVQKNVDAKMNACYAGNIEQVQKIQKDIADLEKKLAKAKDKETKAQENYERAMEEFGTDDQSMVDKANESAEQATAAREEIENQINALREELGNLNTKAQETQQTEQETVASDYDDEDVPRTELSEESKAGIQTFADSLGYNVSFEKHDGSAWEEWDNGYYVGSDNTIYINPAQYGGEGGYESVAYRIATHEITHSLESVNAYYDYQKFALNMMATQNGVSVDTLIRAQIAKRKADTNGAETLTRNGARRELAARFAEENLLKNQDAINKAVRNKKVGGKIFNSIEYMINKANARMSNDVYSEMLLKAENLWVKAYSDAGINPSEGAENIQHSTGNPNVSSVIQDVDNVRDSVSDTEFGNILYEDNEWIFEKNASLYATIVSDRRRGTLRESYYIEDSDMYIFPSYDGSSFLERYESDERFDEYERESERNRTQNDLQTDGSEFRPEGNEGIYGNTGEEGETGRGSEYDGAGREDDLSSGDAYYEGNFSEDSNGIWGGSGSKPQYVNNDSYPFVKPEVDYGFKDIYGRPVNDDVFYDEFSELLELSAKGAIKFTLNDIERYYELSAKNNSGTISQEELLEAGKIVANVLDSVGSTTKNRNPFVYFYGNFIPLTMRADEDAYHMRFSTGRRMSIEDMIAKYGEKESGRDPVREVHMPRQKSDKKGISNLPRSLAESKHMSDGWVDDMMDKVEKHGFGSYNIKTNRATKTEARKEIVKEGEIENAKTVWLTKVDEGIKLKDARVMIAEGEQLIADFRKAYVDNGYAEAQSSIMEIAAGLCELATESGQATQAFNLLKDLGGIGSEVYMERAIKKLNTQYREQIENGKMEEITVSEDLLLDLAQAENEAEMFAAQKAISEEIGRQLPLTLGEQLSNWRFFSMLFNPVTHVRNMGGNLLMRGMRGMKDTIATGIEKGLVATGLMDSKERSHSVYNPFSAEARAVKDVASQVFDDNKAAIDNGGFRGFQKEIEANKRQSYIGFIDKLMNFNDTLLSDVEDIKMFMKPAFTDAYAQFVLSRGMDINRMGAKQKQAALEYATKQAQEAVFHDASTIAEFLNSLGKRGTLSAKVGQVVIDALMPFKKTPINIIKRGFEYSPAGVISSVAKTVNYVSSKGKNIQVNEVIDSWAKTLTGSALAGIGILLKSLGVIRSTGKDEEEEFNTYAKALGYQDYSLQFGDYSLNIGNLAPAVMPLFIGAEMYDAMHNEGADMGEILNVLGSAVGPFEEMTLLSTVNELLSSGNSYGNEETSAWQNAIGTAAKSYVGQYVPTLINKVGNVVVQNVKSTKSDATASNQNMDYYKRNLANKSVVFRGALEDKVGINGEVLTNFDDFGSWALDFANQFILPATVKVTKKSEVDNEIISVYRATGEVGFIPSSPAKYINATVNKKSVRLNMTASQYTDYSKEYGVAVYAALKDVMERQSYQRMSDEDKALALKKAFDEATKSVKNIWKEKLLEDYE